MSKNLRDILKQYKFFYNFKFNIHNNKHAHCLEISYFKILYIVCQ